MTTDPKAVVTVEMTLDQAERYRDSMADVICWCRGYLAGIGPDRRDEGPMNIEVLSDLNIRLKTAIEKAF